MFTKEKDKPVAETEEKKEPKTHGSGNLSGIYYKIEVRSWYMPRVLIDPQHPNIPFVIDKDWKTWPIHLSYGNGPAPSMPVRSWETHAAEHGLLNYDAAMGHLWGMYAFLAARHEDLCIQARLVAIEWHESYSMTEKSVSDVIMPPRRPWDAFMPRAEADEKAKTQEK